MKDLTQLKAPAVPFSLKVSAITLEGFFRPEVVVLTAGGFRGNVSCAELSR